MRPAPHRDVRGRELGGGGGHVVQVLGSPAPRRGRFGLETPRTVRALLQSRLQEPLAAGYRAAGGGVPSLAIRQLSLGGGATNGVHRPRRGVEHRPNVLTLRGSFEPRLAVLAAGGGDAGEGIFESMLDDVDVDDIRRLLSLLDHRRRHVLELTPDLVLTLDDVLLPQVTRHVRGARGEYPGHELGDGFHGVDGMDPTSGVFRICIWAQHGVAAHVRQQRFGERRHVLREGLDVRLQLSRQRLAFSPEYLHVGHSGVAPLPFPQVVSAAVQHLRDLRSLHDAHAAHGVHGPRVQGDGKYVPHHLVRQHRGVHRQIDESLWGKEPGQRVRLFVVFVRVEDGIHRRRHHRGLLAARHRHETPLRIVIGRFIVSHPGFG